MPSEKTLELKKQQVAALSESLKTACTGIIVDYKGISVADDTVLRKKLRESGNTYTVVKNTILGRALEAAGSKAWKLIWKVPRLLRIRRMTTRRLLRPSLNMRISIRNSK